jgi:SecD/SecF fusion protein
MIEHLRRKLILVGLVVAAALALIVLPQTPLRLGLDLAGGVRFVYRVDIEQARRDGQITPQETDAQVMEDTIAICRNRVDPTGVLDPIIRKVGEDRIEFLIPGIAEMQSAAASAGLAQELAPEAIDRIVLDIPADDQAGLAKFPGGGGVVRIGDEKVRYERRVGNELTQLVRGLDHTEVQRHPSGASLRLVSDDMIKNAIENLGNLRFMIVARDSDLVQHGTSLDKERQRLKAWHESPGNTALDVSIYDALPRELGGPPPNLHFAPRRQAQGEPYLPPFERGEMYALIVQKPEWDFTGGDLSSVYKTSDDLGTPAVGFEFVPGSVNAFTKFTTEYKGLEMAILLNGEVVTAPTIEDVLPGRGIIRGRFTDQEVQEMVTVLRSGSLRIKPILENEERVSATVGTDAMQRGKFAGGVSLAVIVLFMILYYRRLGVFASIGLVCNLVLVLGAMVALQATLTLPGIAGMILTIGMAVDANILIFDRIREEAELGRKTLQAVKAGFQNALSAIVDSNVTTLLSAFILYNIGTGPVRGFAVTLIIGVLTTMFSALVIVKYLMYLDLERLGKEAPQYKMGRWLADANYKFVGRARFVLPITLLVIVVGVVGFIMEDDRKKLGIDFLGGASAKVRTEQPLEIAEIRGRVAALPGDIGKSEVVALPASQQGNGFTEFRITYKTVAGSGEGVEATLQAEVRAGLADVLQKGPLEVSVVSDGPSTRADAVFYFEERHPLDDVRRVIEDSALLTAPSVVQRAGRDNVFEASGQVPAGTVDADLRARLERAFADKLDATGKGYVFASAVPETAVIGKQVVGELRDSAIRALLLSLFVTVLYIRVRFAEYSYGFAAVIALVHDVLFTLGALAFLIWIPWIQVEINLPMIAAFLTIIGYSINDTIVIFDRVRENRLRMKGTLEEIVDRSINQTLSRTICTTGTTFATILIVLAFNLGTGSVLEGFAFAITFGIFVGTFSTLYVATPLFIWFEKRALRSAGGAGGATVALGKQEALPAQAGP